MCIVFRESQYLYLFSDKYFIINKYHHGILQIKFRHSFYFVSGSVEEIDMILERRHLKKRITVSSSVDLQFIHIDSKLITSFIQFD